MEPFFEQSFERFSLIPTFTITTGVCECCGEPAGVMVALEWAFWATGVVFSSPHAE